MLNCVMAPLIYSNGTMKASNMTVPCWVCGRTLTLQAKVCPHCGHHEPAAESIKRFEERRKQELEEAATITRGRREDFWLLGLMSVIIDNIVLAILLFVSGYHTS